ncbi:hypothetical protein EJ06DRAFT_527560 [Trichodelitschia bisporula]|uniref:Uncharacterized protein n=1 Tax=Trichodelitschia bisporula TaxID=703511 RepID=A0A6G1I7D3_9PEZI|nr:hypothetical protein EJ06DRAFT_527560 [Trichodelitschia bisporula]
MRSLRLDQRHLPLQYVPTPPRAGYCAHLARTHQIHSRHAHSRHAYFHTHAPSYHHGPSLPFPLTLESAAAEFSVA